MTVRRRRRRQLAKQNLGAARVAGREKALLFRVRAFHPLRTGENRGELGVAAEQASLAKHQLGFFDGASQLVKGFEAATGAEG